MLRKVLKWLPVLAASTMTFSLYAASDAPSAEEVAVGQRFAARPQANNNTTQANSNSCNTNNCAPPPAPCAPKPSCQPCCIPAKFCAMPLCEPPCYDPCCPPMTVYNHNVNPSSRCTADNNGASIMVDFLWWRADEAETPYAFVNTDPTNSNTGYIANINYKWKPGVRVALGWDTAYDGWDLLADWTWYRQSAHSSVDLPTLPGVTVSPQGEHFPLLVVESGAVLDPPFNSASAKYRMLYNMFDLDLGRGYYVSCGLAMRPYVGVKGGWINRRLGVSTGSVDPTNPQALTLESLTPSNFSAKVNYWGVGPHAGLNTCWKVGMGFEFFGNVSGALLYGKSSKNRESIVLTGPLALAASPPLAPISNISNKKHNWRTVPTAQIVLGLGWGDCFNCSKIFFGVGVAWEANYYWNLPGFINPAGNQAAYTFAKNLDLNGLTVDVRLDF